jgi:hypothetical protein
MTGAAAGAALLLMLAGQDPQPVSQPQTLQIAFSPVLAQAPIFGAVVTVPDGPNLPSGGSAS